MVCIEVDKKICSAAIVFNNKEPDWPGLFISNKDYLYIQSILEDIQVSPHNEYTISIIKQYFNDTIQKDHDQWLETEEPQQVETVNTSLEHRVETGIVRLTFKGSHNTGFFIRGDNYFYLRILMQYLVIDENQSVKLAAIKILELINQFKVFA